MFISILYTVFDQFVRGLVVHPNHSCGPDGYNQVLNKLLTSY